MKKTKKYANKTISRNCPLCCRSMWNSWTEVTIDEMKKFIGLISSMGILSMSSYKKYWSKELLFKNEHFPTVMSRERFESIMRFFSFGEKLLFENEWLSKLWMILDFLNKVMLDVITPEKHLSIYESMMLWCGHLVFQQYSKNKHCKHGIKLFELCMHDGLVLTVETYGGQGFNDKHSLGQTAAIVLKLINLFLNKG